MNTAIPVREAGFAHAVHDAQHCFRVLLQALSRPCLPQALPASLPQPPAPLTPVMAAVLLTLCDGDTPLWLAPDYNTPSVRAWLRFHASCPVVDAPEAAVFAATPHFDALPPLEAFATGSPAFPDQSATLLVGIPSFHGMTVPGGVGFAATGPGIRERASLCLPAGALPADFDRRWAANTAAYPLGVDMLLLAPGHVLGLPRTTRLTPFSQTL